MAVSDWDTNPVYNVTIEGVDVGEGSLAKWLNDVVRGMCAAIRSWYNVSYGVGINTTIQAEGGALPASPADGHILMEY